MIYTVFPETAGDMPQDFETYAEAQEYADARFPDGKYHIAGNDGDVE